MDGAGGDDTVTGGAGLDSLLGGDGQDLVDGGDSNDTLRGGAGDDTLLGGTGVDDLYGDGGDDSLDGGASADNLYGGVGNDTFVGGGHAAGEYDFASYRDSGVAVAVNLASGVVLKGGAGTDTLIAIDGAIGSSYADTLIGSDGDNYLRGRGGSDSIDGGAGFDIADYRDSGSTTANLATGRAGYASNVVSGVTVPAGTDTLLGIEGLSASHYDDTLTGDAGDNYLRGQRGNDLIDGGAGADRAVYNQATGAVTVNLALGTATGADGNDTLVGIENLRGSAYGDTLIGDTGANHVEAREGNDSVDGGAGNDTLVGESGNDSLQGGDGEDVLLGGIGNDTLSGGTQPANEPDASGRAGRQFFDWADYSGSTGAVNVDLAAGTATGEGSDVLIGIEAVRGSAGNDTLAGDAGDNLFRGNGGDDSIAGGAGIDVVEYGNASGSVNVNLATGTASGAAGNDSFSSIEVAIGGAYDDTLTGDAGDNAIRGNAGDDLLDGGAGVDRVDYRTAGAAVVVDLDGGFAFGGDGNDTLVGFENLRGTDLYDDQLGGDAGANVIEGRGGNDSLSGAGGNDTLVGDEGDDRLLGGAGNDQLRGGAGDDTYVLGDADTGTDTVSDSGGTADTLASRDNGFGVYSEFYRSGSSLVIENYDELSTGALLSRTVIQNHATTGHIEWLVSTDAGSGATTTLALAAAATGSAADDLVAGTTSNDTLTGLAGDDVLWGHIGNDSLDGGSGADALRGGAGADTLNGGIGADDMLGQAGNDVYIVDDAGDVVDEHVGYGPNASADAGGIDTVNVTLATAGATYVLGAYVENLVLQGSATLRGTGNALANTITGNAAANVLDGGAGADTLTGGLGNDSYYVDTLTDVISETSTLATEIDSVISGVSWTLGANLERLTLSGSAAINGTGNALANTLTGNAAANVLDGGAGADTLTGGLGNDTYHVDALTDVISETSTLATEIDSVVSGVTWTLGANLERLTLSGSSAINGTGNALANLLTGNTGANTLNGGTGNDTLVGGAGNDILTGGTGNDVFRFTVAPNASTNIDRIADFSAADDTIQLENAVFAKLTTTGTLSASYFRAGAGAHALDSNDYVIYDSTTGKLFYDADGSGSGAAVQIALLTGAPAITSADIFIT
ncbi:MAG: calcium-binding protein [Piscinibacter sp.]